MKNLLKLYKYNLIRFVQSHSRQVYSFIALSLLGIILLQVYLIYLIIDLRKTDFCYRVEEALTTIQQNVQGNQLLKRKMEHLVDQHQAPHSPLDPVMVGQVLDSLKLQIYDALEAQDVMPSSVEFSVFSKRSQRLLLSSQKDVGDLGNYAKYTFDFPYVFVQGRGETYVMGLYFPKELGYILGQLWQVFLLSLLWLAIILALFWSAILTIASQEQLISFRNEFINNLAHELKTPVFAASLIHKIAKKSLVNQNYEKLTKQLTLLEMENKDLSKRVERILEYSMLEEGKVWVNYQPIDLNEILDRCANLYTPIVNSKGGSLILENQGLPRTMHLDPIQIKNVFHNLLDNAIKYAGREPFVYIRCETEGQEVIINIRDNGKGISPEDQPFIFEKFYRASQGDLHNAKGFGLGLAYVKQVIEAHQGRIKLDSNIGMGTTFSLTLPIEPNHQQCYATIENTLDGR